MTRSPKLARVALLLLVVLFVSSACGAKTAALSPTVTPSVAPYPTSTPYPTNTPLPAWLTYTVKVPDAGAAQRTFKIDMPSALVRGAGSGPAGHGNYDFYPLFENPSGDRPVAVEMYIGIDVSVVSDGYNTCRSGTPVTVDHDITGYQAYSADGTCYGSHPAATPPAARVFWLTNGVCFIMAVDVTYSGPQGFNTRYGALWQHMLASFVPPAPPPSGSTTCS